MALNCKLVSINYIKAKSSIIDCLAYPISIDVTFFLDVLITKQEDGSLGHQVFRKKKHIDNYLHADSHHYLAKKFVGLNTLALRAVRISDNEHFVEELNHLTQVFKEIQYKIDTSLNLSRGKREGRTLKTL